MWRGWNAPTIHRRNTKTKHPRTLCPFDSRPWARWRSVCTAPARSLTVNPWEELPPRLHTYCMTERDFESAFRRLSHGVRHWSGMAWGPCVRAQWCVRRRPPTSFLTKMEGSVGKEGQRTLVNWSQKKYSNKFETHQNVQMPFPGACIRPWELLSTITCPGMQNRGELQNMFF